MSSSVRFVRNPRFLAELARERGVRAVEEGYAHAAARAARGIAVGFRRSGAYHDSIFADGSRFGSTDPVAHMIEWGSVNNPPYAPLRRAAEQVGGRYVDDARGGSE